MSDRRMLIPVASARCHCCAHTDRCVTVPVTFGPYQTTIRICETCIKVAGAAFDVAATLRLEDAVANRAARLGRPS